jgi:hypothetical protein
VVVGAATTAEGVRNPSSHSGEREKGGAMICCSASFAIANQSQLTVLVLLYLAVFGIGCSSPADYHFRIVDDETSLRLSEVGARAEVVGCYLRLRPFPYHETKQLGPSKVDGMINALNFPSPPNAFTDFYFTKDGYEITHTTQSGYMDGKWWIISLPPGASAGEFTSTILPSADNTIDIRMHRLR